MGGSSCKIPRHFIETRKNLKSLWDILNAWWNQSIVTTEEAKRSDIRDLFDRLSTNEKGLSSLESERRLLQYGRNEIPEKKVNPAIRFSRYFRGPIPGMIEIAIIISAIDRRWADFWIILTLLALNAVVGFWQEYKADNCHRLPKAEACRWDGD